MTQMSFQVIGYKLRLSSLPQAGGKNLSERGNRIQTSERQRLTVRPCRKNPLPSGVGRSRATLDSQSPRASPWEQLECFCCFPQNHIIVAICVLQYFVASILLLSISFKHFQICFKTILIFKLVCDIINISLNIFRSKQLTISHICKFCKIFYFF